MGENKMQGNVRPESMERITTKALAEAFIEERKTKPIRRHDDRIIRKSFKDRLNNPDEDRTRTDDVQATEENGGTKTR